jgi:hypothetical protein
MPMTTSANRRRQRQQAAEQLADRLVALVRAALEDDDHPAPPGVKEWLQQAILRHRPPARDDRAGRLTH